LHAEADVKQLFEFHYQRNMTVKFTQIEPSELLCGKNMQGKSRVPFKNEDIGKLQEMLQMSV